MICVAKLVVLLAVLGIAASRPGGDGDEGASESVSYKDVQATCPYNIHSLATPEKISGTWNLVECLGEEHDKSTHEVPCMTYEVSGSGHQMSTIMRVVENGTEKEVMHSTTSQSSNGLWESKELGHYSYLKGLSKEEDIMFICGAETGSSDTVLAFALTRSPDFNVDDLSSHKNENAREFSAVHLDQQSCTPSSSYE